MRSSRETTVGLCRKSQAICLFQSGKSTRICRTCEHKLVHTLLKLTRGQAESDPAHSNADTKWHASRHPVRHCAPSHCHRSRVVFDLCTLEAPVGSAVRGFNTEPIQLIWNRTSAWTSGYSMSWWTCEIRLTYIYLLLIVPATFAALTLKKA